MGPGDWRATILGKQAIGHVRRVLVEYLNDLESGHVDLVRESLLRRLWRTGYDWTGVPPVMLDRLDGACDDAAGHRRIQRRDPAPPARAIGRTREGGGWCPSSQPTEPGPHPAVPSREPSTRPAAWSERDRRARRALRSRSDELTVSKPARYLRRFRSLESDLERSAGGDHR